VEQIPDSCHVVAWRPPVPEITEVFHAQMADFRYPAHCHDTWTVLIVDHGAIRYQLDTRDRGAVGATVTVLPPGVTHDGGPSERFGRFRKRNLYLDGRFLPAELIGSAVDRSSFDDPELRVAISALHDRLVDHPDPLDVEGRLTLIADRLARRLRRRPSAVVAAESDLAARLRAFLHDRVTERTTLADAAAALDRSVPHLVRSFRRAYGLSPYAYVIGARIELARRRLLDGEPPGLVAVEVGFHDQAHLTRHFKRHVSVPPATYAASGRDRGGPDGNW
jgi:AraC-like DNA-binding protein